ncbi:DUF1793-domain-containing protein [Pleomassaria siparia CBS 279.74]|uniref:DUF1793-domain-containing protein n=1 Tax=Pleomassaria siparia CBS 279.74 TaxID=1314801 RepID=A0A6G1JZ61_9PLEO|nr:DUF1793-domain-containing protein [Pleomassaria siparia CBS 279.74]
MLLSWLGVLGGLFSLATANSTFSPARPPSIPLAVKSPYLSLWQPAGVSGGNGGYLPGQWPSFYTGDVVAWTGLIRVDGNTFVWMGSPIEIQAPLATQVAFEYTSTKSIFTIEVDGKVSLKATFLSPVTPTDFKRQSLVFSYLNVEVSSMDGAEHDVQLYTDISAEWVSGDLGAVAQWDTNTVDDLAYHQLWKRDQGLFQEIADRAEWGTWYYTTDNVDALTSQSAFADDVRLQFKNNGKLTGSKDTNFRAIRDQWPAFGYAIDLGNVGSTATSNLFSIGLCQEDAIQFLGANGLRNLPSLWKSYFADDVAAVSFFHKDFNEANKLATDLDNKVASDSKAAAGDAYNVVTSLAVRQTFGATQLVGTEEKHYLFLKEISSNGNTQTVDVIFPATPIFYYLNSELVKLLLDPHFENQESGHYPNKYAMHDLGTHYPNATGHEDGADEEMPLEECGNNLIMTLAYAQRSEHGVDYLKAHYPLLKQWVEYLVEESVYPAEQLSTDDFAGHLANQTNLALKGIIGIGAMAEISKLVGEDADAQNYTSISKDYVQQWMPLAHQGNNHTVLTYNNATTHGLLYNLYADRLLNTSIISQEVYDQQSAFYPTVKQAYGVPLDTRNLWTKSDWEMFCAAIASTETRDMFISDLARWVTETDVSKPFTDLFETPTGQYPGGIQFKARPVMGGMFSILALQHV